MKRYTKESLVFFWGHLRRHKGLLFLTLFGILSAVIGELTWVVIFREFFDGLSMDAEKSVIVQLLWSSLIYLILVEIWSWVSWRIAAFSANVLDSNIMANIANDCFSHIHKHSLRFFNKSFGGALVKKAGRMVSGYEGLVEIVIWSMIPMALHVVLITVILFFVRPVLGWVMLAWTVVFIVVNYYLAVYKWKYDLKSSMADTEVTAALADTITNVENVKYFSGFNYEKKRFSRKTDKWRDENKKAWDLNQIIEAGQGALMIVLEFVILALAIKLWEQGQIVLADFYLIQAYLFEIFHQLWNFGRNLRQVFEQMADVEEMTEILELKPEIRDKRGAKKLALGAGKVEFVNVDFHYKKNEEVVLEKLCLKIKAGEKVALIGPSGGGKSTIVKLILRLFDIQKGQILLDKQDISKVTQDSLRSQVVLVPQDPVLFHRTLMENIRYGRRDASDEEVLAAAKMAHCDEFIARFPKGYQTYVGERGVMLSGGQRQRVAIARAILSNAKVLILDEATSSLDSESESLIQDAIENLTKQKTTIVIAHRLSTIMNVDKIFVLEAGKVVQVGSHAELMQAGGLYKKLWDLQVGGYI